MKDWLKIHQILFVLLIFLILAQCLCAFFILKAHKEELAEVEDDLATMHSRLRKVDMPLDADKLESFLNTLKKELEGKAGGDSKSLRRLGNDAFSRAGATFSEQIEKGYGSVADFIKNVSKLDYQSEYNRILTELKEKKVLLSPDVLTLKEEMPTPYNYQPLIQIWSVEKIVNACLESGIAICSVESGGRKKSNVAQVSVLPMKAYFVSADSLRPYLLEFPVSISVEGSIEQCYALLDSLNTDKLFIPPTAFELYALPPSGVAGGDDGFLKSGVIRMKLVCSAFVVIGTQR